MELIETKIENGLQILDEKEASLVELREKYVGLKISGLEDKAGYKAVREARLKLKDARVQIQKDGKALRENAVKFQKRVIERENQLIEIISSTETSLLQEEESYNALVEQERQRKEKEENDRIQARVDALAKFNYAVDLYQLSIMSDEDFQATLGHAESEYLKEQEILESKRLEDERIKREEEERIKREREELTKLRAEQEQRERELKRQEQERIEAARVEAEKLRKEREAHEAKMKAEREAIEAERRAIELEKAKAEAAERAKREEQERIEREAKEKAERERLAKIEAERQEALKPDKQKLIEFADRIKSIPFPEVEHADTVVLLKWIDGQLTNLSTSIKEKAKAL